MRRVGSLAMADCPVSSPTRIRYGAASALRQLVKMQEVIFETMNSLREDVQASTDKDERARTASSIASLAKGWEALEERKRILRRIPNPGSLRPQAKMTPKRPQLLQPTEEP